MQVSYLVFLGHLALSLASPIAPSRYPASWGLQTQHTAGDSLDVVHMGPCDATSTTQAFDFDSNSHLKLRGQNVCIDAHGCGVGGIVITWGCDAGQNNQFFTLQADGTIFNSKNGLCIAPWEALPYSSIYCETCSDSMTFSYDSVTGKLALTKNSSLCLDTGPVPKCDPTTVYCNSSYNYHDRALDLASRMSLREKASFMTSDEVPVSRLGVPGHRFGEVLHGVVSGCGSPYEGNSGCPTSFPHALLMSSAFNRTLWRTVGDAVGTEARSLNNQGAAAALGWAPDINLFRDPRWGRGQEVPGEDPLLTSEYVTHYSRGLQEGPDSKYIRVVSTAKHFVAYDLEGNHGVNRDTYNAIVSDQDLVEYYMPAFRAAVEGAHVHSIMCSYNQVNGMPACSDDLTLNQVLREQWQFDGFVVSDCGAISDPASRNYAKKKFGSDDGKYLVCDGVSGGCDLSCGNEYSQSIEAAVNSSLLTQAAVDQALVRILDILFRWGFLDNNVTYTDINRYGPAQVDTPGHRQLALEAAQQGMVLLKNDNKLLPLHPAATVAVIGPHFNATDDMLSIYRGTAPFYSTPLQALSDRGHVVAAVQGCDTECLSTVDFPEAVAAAGQADVAIVLVGLTPGQMKNDSSDAREDEGWDRQFLTLPGSQEELIRQVVAANPNTVVVLIHGGPLAIEWTKANVPAIVDAHFPGENGGAAIASILYGDVSPAGRLTTTVYPADFIEKRPISDQSLRDNGGITYMHYTGTPLWEFGFGLSFTTFDFQPLSAPLSLSTHHVASLWLRNRSNGRSRSSAVDPQALQANAEDEPSYSVRVTNTGLVTSDCVVLGFVSSNQTDAPANKELFDFARVSALAPGQSQDVFFSISPEVLALVNREGVEYIAPGTYRVSFGVDGAAEGQAAHTTLVLAGPVVALTPPLAHLSSDS
eukprot:c9709_g2_i1.p1 GENE.c9709_g2_i1~~c9709_g2_i1.p1  ORF type:complete len:924 (+),score=247.23 c9709_g2_i1:172-2943(+)